MTDVPMMPSCQRAGLDMEIISELQAMDDLVFDLRQGLQSPSQITDEESAVRTYLEYIGILVHSVASDIMVSAMTKNDAMGFCKLRLLLEYSIKGAYYDDNPDYALYMTTIGRVKDILEKLQKAHTNQQAIVNATNAVAEMERRFPHVAKLP
jgi:hypothetical protein